MDAKAVVSEFINQQERLLKILRIAHSKDIQKIKIPISIAKFLKLHLGDALQFLVMHNERHILQAKLNLVSNLLFEFDIFSYIFVHLLKNILMKKFTLLVLLITLLQAIAFAQTNTVDLLIKDASIINISTGKIADNQVIAVKNG